MASSVHVGTPMSTAQGALDEALEAGQAYHDAGYLVGPPWWWPEPVPGTFPPAYRYLPRVTYGDGPEALTAEFLGFLWGSRDEALVQAEQLQADLIDRGYVVRSISVVPVVWEGRSYYQARFWFGMPGASFEAPGGSGRGLVGAIGATAGIVLVGSLLLGTVGEDWLGKGGRKRR